MIKFSSKLDYIKPSASMELAQHAQMLKRQGKNILDLSLGEPDFNVPALVKEGLFSAINNNLTHYTSSLGILELRQELAKYIGYNLTPDNIMVIPGSKYGIYIILNALVDPGEEVILIEPYWLSYNHMVTLVSGRNVYVKTDEKRNFVPDLYDLERVITTKSKVIIINNPSNPSGRFIPKDTLDGIVEICRKKGITIIADEIYSDLAYEDGFYSMLNYDYENIIISSGFSKNMAMTGLRIGYIIAQPNAIKAINKVHQHIGTCAPSITQYSLVGNIAEVLKKDVKEMKGEYLKRKLILETGLKDTIFSCIKPQATFYMLLNISGLQLKSFEASKFILEQAEIATVPGIAYGDSMDNFVRISFATSVDVLKEAVQRFKKIGG